MFKKLFGRKGKNEGFNGLQEPIFPEGPFAVSQISDESGFYGISNVNRGYNHYPNKKYFPWCVQLTIEFQNTNENGMPNDMESEILDDIEAKIEGFIAAKHKMHFIGRVTRKSFRDVIFYVDSPNFGEAYTNEILDGINKIRRINFSVENDPNWNFVSGLLN